MKESETTICSPQLAPIPVEFVVDYAAQKAAGAKRAPYIELVQKWAAHENMQAAALKWVRSMTGEQQAKPGAMPRGVCQRYRQGEKAQQFIDKIIQLDQIITAGKDGWTWPHAMRTMIDVSILERYLSVREFERIIRAIIPGKKDGSVRRTNEMLYRNLLINRENMYQAFKEGNDKDVCRAIARFFRKITERP